MALETASYVANLVESNPDGLDQRSTADNHLRLIKAALKRTFPKMDGPVSLSSAQVMYIGDLSASAQLQLNQLRDGSATANNALYANSASYAAVAGNTLAVGGVSHSDVAILTRTTDQTFVGAVVVRTSGSVGSAAFRSGSANFPGYIEFRTAEGTRRGYIGFGTGTSLQLLGENNWNWDFSGSVAPTISGNSILHAASTLDASKLFGSVPSASIPLAAVQQHQSSLTVASAATATTATTASNASAVNGFAASQATVANTVAARTVDGDIQTRYFVETGAVENGAVTAVVTQQGSGFLLPTTLTNLGSQLDARNITGRAGTTKTLTSGSGPPSLVGSTNGDMWFYY